MLAFVLAAAALPGFALKAETPRADYYVLAGDAKLRVAPEKCDRKLAGIEKALGVRVPRFSYRRVRTETEVMTNSREQFYAGGVADPSDWSIVAMEACSGHELTHLATFSIGRADDVTEEGVASMLGGDYDWVARWNARQRAKRRGDRYPAVQQRFDAHTPSVAEKHDWYVLADAWARHLRTHHGMSSLVLYIRMQGQGKSAADAFRLVYGGDLHAAFDHWLYGKKGPPTQKPTRR